jgi:hypothetical protein
VLQTTNEMFSTREMLELLGRSFGAHNLLIFAVKLMLNCTDANNQRWFTPGRHVVRRIRDHVIAK